jgi:hypothetical protein
LGKFAELTTLTNLSESDEPDALAASVVPVALPAFRIVPPILIFMTFFVQEAQY